MKTRLKICCIASVEEAHLAIAAGADALGLVAEMPSGPGPIADNLIARIAGTVPPPISRFLLTSRTDAAVRELGGTGRTHDWAVSRRIVETCGRPVFLAGGLNAGNVADAIAQVGPYGLDLCSSVRTDGKLDAAKLARLVAAIR